MIFTDSLLDTSWTLQFMSGVRRKFKRLDELISVESSRGASTGDLERLGNELHDHLSYQDDNEPKDELKDQSAAHARLWKYSLSTVSSNSADNENTKPCGLLIEARHQLHVYRVLILRRRYQRDITQDLALILSRGNQKFVNNVKEWLGITFELPPAENLHLAPFAALEILSGVVDAVSTGWPSDASRTDAIRLVLVRHVIGNIRMNITITSVGTDLATKLKHVDLDVPCDTINELIVNDTSLGPDAKSTGDATLDKLSSAIHKNTGLILPFTMDHLNGDKLNEQPWKVSKISCAAFALSVEGELKLSGKPIEQAELMGYEGNLVRDAMSRILEKLFKEAESRVRSSSEN